MADTIANANATETLDALRARGAAGMDPVRFRFIEAMARRAELQQGAARDLLRTRLAALLAGYAGQVDPSSGAQQGVPSPAVPGPLAALTALTAQLDRHAASRAPARTTLPALAAPAEPPALAYMRSTWSRLSAQRRLARSLEQLPENAGPLNSQRLVHRALSLMHDASPEYLRRFMAHAEVLMWLEQAQADAASGKDAARPRNSRKPRGKTA